MSKWQWFAVFFLIANIWFATGSTARHLVLGWLSVGIALLVLVFPPKP